MPLTKLVVKNYKSLRDFQLDIKPLMVFIGPNNTGKSNIFDCFKFLSEAIKIRGLQGSVIQRGGFNNIIFNGEIGNTISIELHGSLQIKGEEKSYKYSIEFGGNQFGNCYNNRETFVLKGPIYSAPKVIGNETQRQIFDEIKLLEFPGENGMAIARDETGKQMGGFGAGNNIVYLSSFSDPLHYPVLSSFHNEVQNWAFFNFVPQLMRDPLPIQKELQLKFLGENMATVLHALQTEYPQKFKKIEDILKSALPQFDELGTGLTAAPGQTYIKMREKELNVDIPAWGMSDGLLRLLGLLISFYSPSPPPLACYEEPENFVHPRLLELIVDLLKNASENKTQVMATTHSPYLVDLLQPEDLFIVEKKDGETKIKKAEDKKGIKEALKTLGLGDMWYSGSLGGNPNL
jgi:predicted ATPase